MDVSSVPLDQLDVITAKFYGDARLPARRVDAAAARVAGPLHAPAGYKPFWAITKHADIIEVSTQPEKFRSAGRFILFPEAAALPGQSLEENPPLRMLVNMDPPEHRDYRKLVSALVHAAGDPAPGGHGSRRSPARSSTSWRETAAGASATSSARSRRSSRCA